MSQIDDRESRSLIISTYVVVTIATSAWILLLLYYVAIAAYVLWLRLHVPAKAVSLFCVLLIVPLAGLLMSVLLPRRLRRRGRPGIAMLAALGSLVLWFPAVVWTFMVFVIA